MSCRVTHVHPNDCGLVAVPPHAYHVLCTPDGAHHVLGESGLSSHWSKPLHVTPRGVRLYRVSTSLQPAPLAHPTVADVTCCSCAHGACLFAFGDGCCACASFRAVVAKDARYGHHTADVLYCICAVALHLECVPADIDAYTSMFNVVLPEGWRTDRNMQHNGRLLTPFVLWILKQQFPWV